MKRGIPECRRVLEELALRLEDRGLFEEAEILIDIVADLHRRPPARKPAPVRCRKLSEDDRGNIRKFAMANPQVPLSEIAALFGTNQGRVSEALRP